MKLTDNAGAVRNLTSATTGELLWDGGAVQMAANSFTQINAVAPLTAVGANILTIDTLWKPSTVTTLTGLTAAASDATGVLVLRLDGSESRTQLYLEDSGGTTRTLAPSLTGALVWNGGQLVNINDLSSYATTAQLATKQDALTTPGPGVFLSGTTLSGYTLRWNTNSTHTLNIQELHFSGYTVSETLNISTQLNELTIGAPTDMATMTWTNQNFTDTAALTTPLAGQASCLNKQL